MIFRYQQGDSAELIHDQYPTLDVNLIRDVITFYRENRTEVDAYMDQVRARIEEFHAGYQPGPGILRIRELREGGELEAPDRTDSS